jgi:hypothetical protein
VIEAYQRSGRIPERGSYRGLYGTTACGVGAVSLAQKPSIADALDIFQTFVYELDYGLTYHDGFTKGFDGRPRELIDPEMWEFKRFVDGYEDGRAAWDAVQALIPEEEG